MVWINEVPWHEMNVDQELTLRCEHPWARNLEEEPQKQSISGIISGAIW